MFPRPIAQAEMQTHPEGPAINGGCALLEIAEIGYPHAETPRK